MKKEFKSLSEKIFSNFWIHTLKDSKLVYNVILAKDVKKAVELLKEETVPYPTHNIINKIFGKDLI